MNGSFRKRRLTDLYIMRFQILPGRVIFQYITQITGNIKNIWEWALPNVANNSKYVESLKNNTVPFEKEELTPETNYNDYLLTSLRTMWGADINHVKKAIGEKYADYFLLQSKKFIDNGEMIKKGDICVLSSKGKFLADYIISELMYIDE